jgi:hypothetical protein
MLLLWQQAVLLHLKSLCTLPALSDSFSKAYHSPHSLISRERSIKLSISIF